MSQVIESIQKSWPGVPIVYRKLHRPYHPEDSGESFCQKNSDRNQAYEFFKFSFRR